MSKIANDGLTWSGTGWMLCSCTHVATVGIKGFNVISSTVNPTIPCLPDDSVSFFALSVCSDLLLFYRLHGSTPHTLLTSFVRWQMSRLVSDSAPVHLHHWLSAAPDSLLSVTELSWSPLHVSGTVCHVTSAPSVAVFRSRLKTHLFNISYPCACTVPVQWH